METKDVSKMIDTLVKNAETALEGYMKLNQEQVDKLVHEMTLAGVDNHMYLASEAVKETGRGVLEDKVIKNIFATEYIWHSIKNQKTVGVIESNELEDYDEIAEPIGIVAGVTPVTNPTSTTMITDSYNSGNVSGESYGVGGLIGSASSTTITDSYNSGNVSGESFGVGGLLGYASSTTITITNSYVIEILNSYDLNIVSIPELNSQNFYTNVLTWDTSVWNFENLDYENGLTPTFISGE